MGWAIAAATIASSVMSYTSQKKAEKATKRANAATMAAAEEEASLTRLDGAEKARQERLDAKRVRAQQLALYLKSGVTLDGSPMLVADTTTERGKRNSDNTLMNAESQAKSMILRGQAGQAPVQRADLFGTAATSLGAAKDAGWTS